MTGSIERATDCGLTVARRKLITGDRRSALIRRLLLRSRFTLDPASRWAVDAWVERHPDPRELYAAKELLHAVYRIRGADRAAAALTALTDRLAGSALPELHTFIARSALNAWRSGPDADPSVAERFPTTVG